MRREYDRAMAQTESKGRLYQQGKASLYLSGFLYSKNGLKQVKSTILTMASFLQYTYANLRKGESIWQ